MAQFNIILTDAGLALMARAQTGDPINFTAVQVGSGELGETDPSTLTALINSTMTLPLLSMAHDGTQASVRAVLDNTDLESGFQWREIGILAEDPDAGPDILYAYGNAGELGDYIPPGSASRVMDDYTITVGVGTAETVTAEVTGTLAYALASDLDDHVGAGGTDQHPAATSSVAGFLSATDKTKLDGLTAGGYLVQTIGSLVTTLSAFNSASPKYGRGVYASRAGELDYAMTSFACTTVLSMVVSASQNTTVTIPIFCNDDTVKLYIDGALAYSRDGSGTLTTTSESLTTGDHCIQWLINNYDGASYLHVGEWFSQYVTFVRAATS